MHSMMPIFLKSFGEKQNMGIISTTNEHIPFSQEVVDKIMKLRIIDDTLFRYLANNKAAISEIINGYLGKHVNIIDTNPQATLTNVYREVILDSLSYLDDNSYVDIEMQNKKEHNDVKRCRYHASLITANKTSKTCEFKDIPNVIIIYIMDYLGYGNVTPVNHISLDDGYDLYLATNKITDASDVSELTQLLSNSSLEMHNDKYPAICECFNRIKKDKEVISEMCRIMEDYADERENLMLKIIELVNKGLSDAEIINKLSCTIEQITKTRTALGK